MNHLLKFGLAFCCVSMINPAKCGIDYECWLLEDGTKIAWRRTEGDDWVDIQMSRPDTGDYTTPLFVSVGFSRDQSMGDDAVTECVFTGDQAAAYVSWNNGKSNTRSPQDIVDNHITLVASRRSQGDLYCRVRQRMMPAADIGGIMDLNTPYILLAAIGTAKPTGINIHDFTSSMPAIYTQQVNVAEKTYTTALNVDPVAPPSINGMPPNPPIPSGLSLPRPIGNQPPSLPVGTVGTQAPPVLPPLPPVDDNNNSVQPEPEAETEPESEGDSHEANGHAEPESESEPNTITGDENRTKPGRGQRAQQNRDNGGGQISGVLSVVIVCVLSNLF